MSFGGPAERQTVRSNSVEAVVDKNKRPTKLGFRLLPDDFPLPDTRCEQQGGLDIAYSQPISAETLAAASPMARLDISHIAMFVLDNPGGNRDGNVREEAFIKVETGGPHQDMRLLETVKDSGVFAGAVPAQAPGKMGDPCDLDVRRGLMLSLSFVEDDYSYGSTTSILIDPAGIVFDSGTGATVDGAVITLLDENDRPATVFGDDGVSAYPSTVTSGAGATDASGRGYDFPPGYYRFPLALPGRYHLRIEPPGGYTAPSKKDRGSIEALRDASGRPYLLNPASFGGVFQLVTPDPFHADIPLDPPAARAKKPTTLSFRLLPDDLELRGLRCEVGALQTAYPADIDSGTLAAAPAISRVGVSRKLILVLENQGGNHDPLLREVSFITASSGQTTQRIRLLETALDSGIFAGGVPAIPPGSMGDPCYLDLQRGSSLTLSFTEDDFSFASQSSILIDPAGVAFDSRTGAVVDGAVVTLLGENDQPATVFGDDGIARYPSTVVSGAGTTDASGRRYDFPPGFYRFPLTPPGRYHLRVEPPGTYTAPSQQDRGLLASLTGPMGKPFILNPASFGGVFDLATLEPLHADIPLDRPGKTQLLLTKTASVREASPGDFVQYRVSVANREAAPVRNVRLVDTLPPGLRFERGSHRGVDAPVIAADGRTLTFAIPEIAGGATLDLGYVVSIAPGAPEGESVNRVVASGASAFAGITSNEASSSVRIRPLLFTDGFTVIGRVTEGACGDPAEKRKGVSGVRLLMEDGTFVVTDRDGLYHFEGVRPGRHIVQLDTGTIPASHAAVACDADTRQAGSAISRFVESGGGLLKRVDFQLRPTGERAKVDAALPIAIADDATAAGARDWLTGQQPGVALLFPGVDHNPRAPALRVVVKHLPGQRVALTLNGMPTGPLAFDATDADPAGTVAISRWTGLPLIEGDNRLVARVLDASGATVATLDRVVHSARVPADVTFAAEKSRLVADGITRPLIAVRVTDRDGRPVRAGTLLPFRVDQPHMAAVDAELEQALGIDGVKNAATTVRVVGDDGLAFIALQPTTQAGAVRASVMLTDGETVRSHHIRAWLTASVKQWIVVGFGSGTLGQDTLRRHGQALGAGERNSTVTDGQLALYAKGRIKGSWLLTLAYDSDRRRDRDRGLLGTIDPDRYYTVYGDGTRQGYYAATARKLYLRLERREFYALFGDYETGLTDTRLGRYSRTLNGGKAAFDNGRVTVTAFAARTDERYARDEIQGNGLSGPYRLSGRGIVPNSDKVRIEVRDRFRSELILSSTQLTRHIDYDIDPDMGTLRFREPVLSRDPEANPRFIVAEYETDGRGGKLVAGGRGAVRLAGDGLEIGATALRDETNGVATVLALDARARPTRTTELRAEAATGGRGGLDGGRAWLVEAEHHGAALDLAAYARQQDLGFGVGQQNIVEAGSRKIGVDGSLRIGTRATVTGSIWHQERMASAGSRLAADGRVELRRANGTLFVGAQLASDRGIDGKDRESRLLTLGGSQALAGGRLTLTGQTQVAPGGDKDSVDFPIRHQLSAAYRIRPGIRLLAGYEIADGKDFNARTVQWGFDVAPWTGAKLMSTLNQQRADRASGENGQRTFAQYGLNQSLPLGRHWTVDATLDASSTVSGRIPAGAVINAFQPVASGGSLTQDGGADGDYAAVTVGAGYRGRGWSWNGRAEYRSSERGDRFGITSNALRPLGEGRTVAASLRWFRVEQDSGAVAATTAADVALAWRPLDSRWSVLERLTVRREQADAGFDDRNVLGVPAIGGAYQAALRLINNLAVNYRSGAEGDGHGVEATVYYGAKWVRGSFGADDYSGYIDVTGFDLRHDLGRRFDIGVQGSVQHAWGRKTVAWSVGPTVGMSPARDVWLTAGFNVAGYRDRDFEADRYTRAGPFVTARLKFDQLGLGRAGRAVLGSR
jgi:uncharacterized repeat protein (TIGR01451 family)